MEADAFAVDVRGGTIGGWMTGPEDGARVLVLHGGPGMSAHYLDGLVDELASSCRVAYYQQRGLKPSTAQEPFDVADQAADTVAVLDGLGWQQALAVGHSWGGHLLLHVMTRAPERLMGACVVDPLGGVGDGGMEAFEAEMSRRTPPEDRARATELDDRALAGEATAEEADESLRLFWPAYFPSREAAPAYQQIEMSNKAYAQTYESMQAELPALEKELRQCSVPTLFVHGEMSPMPLSASTDTAAVLRNADVDVVQGAGHFVWLDRPGCVVEAVGRLLDRVRS
jgi:pimeloyl-ACP methyl ester carboxylesterase